MVTKYAWPEPALWLTRAAAALGLSPNVVTIVGLVLTFVAGWQFYVGNLAIGMAAAWLMTLLDTVDGKLARVTLTSSWLGNQLDHGNDLIHPPLVVVLPGEWHQPGRSGISLDVAVLLDHPWHLCDRPVLERGFKKQFGFNPFMWKQFDSRFRMIISRRNIILLIMTVGLAIGLAAEAFVLCAALERDFGTGPGRSLPAGHRPFAPRADPRLARVTKKKQIKQLAWREYLPLAATAAMWAVIVIAIGHADAARLLAAVTFVRGVQLMTRLATPTVLKLRIKAPHPIRRHAKRLAFLLQEASLIVGLVVVALLVEGMKAIDQDQIAAYLPFLALGMPARHLRLADVKTASPYFRLALTGSGLVTASLAWAAGWPATLFALAFGAREWIAYLVLRWWPREPQVPKQRATSRSSLTKLRAIRSSLAADC